MKPLPLRLDDEAAERVRRSHEAAIVELQSVPAVAMVVVSGVVLVDGIATTVAHKLGRKPLWVGISVPRGGVTAGLLVEVRDGAQDLTKLVVITASGFGATITVDVTFL